MRTENVRLVDNYYAKIKRLNIEHYAGETSYYSTAELRSAERTLLASLPKGAKILDVGCGSGRFSVNAAMLGFEVTGIDITPAAIDAAREKAKRMVITSATFKVADIADADFQHEYDFVFCPRFVINAISTDAHRRRAIDNMYRACKPGGKIFIESFNMFYAGKGLFTPIKNAVKAIVRSTRIALSHMRGKSYDGLFPGDIVYEANKAAGASIGYAHLPTIFEIKSYLKSRKTYSIYEIIGTKRVDVLRPFRYSIWTIDDVR